MSPIVRAFFDRPTGNLQYVFHCPKTKQAAIVAPVWNFYPEAGAVTTESADEILAYIEAEALEVAWVLDTHPHADHFSAAPYLSDKLGAPTAIEEKVTGVQKLWTGFYQLGAAGAICATFRLVGERNSGRIGRIVFSVNSCIRPRMTIRKPTV